MEVHGRIAGSSNATLLVTCRLGPDELLAVYKPRKGERPLWDFPGGLFRREVAAYVLSESLGLGPGPRDRRAGAKARSARARCSASCPRTAPRTTSPCATTRSGTRRSCGCAPSTSWPTTPTARAATCCWPRTACGPSTTGSASTRTTSCARSSGTSAESRSTPDDVAGPGTPAADGPSARAARAPRRRPSSRRSWSGWPGCVNLRALPELVDDGGWPPYPWPLV